jgi:hypothetical protein
MVFNNSGLEFPQNLYADLKIFMEEDSARCYYAHSCSAEMPPDAEETVIYLLDNFFVKKEGVRDMVEKVYIKNTPAEGNKDVLYPFFRDLLYFPKFNNILTKGLRFTSL